MTTAFVLGNGVSRQGIDPAILKQQGTVYGCNALYRTFTPDCLVATDRPIAMQIQESGYAQQNRFHTRKPVEGLGARIIPPDYYGFSSGPVATALAAMDGHTLIYMLGFDLGPNDKNSYNNLYADTEFYKPTGSQATFSGNWIKQIRNIASQFKSTQFVRIVGETTAHVKEFETVLNLQHLPICSFLERINTQRNP